jgi:hypothetical protein
MTNSHWGWPIRPTFWTTFLLPKKTEIDFFKGTPSEKKYSQDNFQGIHNFSKF